MVKYIIHYAPAKILPGFLNFLGLIIYARIFTQAEYGRYAYVIAILGLIQSVLFPWIRMSCSRFFQKHYKEGNSQEFENFTLFIFLLVSLCLTVGWTIFLLVYNGEENLKHLYMLGLIVIISQALFEQLMALARAKLQSKVFAFAMILRALSRILVVLLLVYLFNLNEKAMFIGIIIAQIMPIIIYIKKYFKFNITHFKINNLFIKETFQYGFPLTFTFLLTFIISSSDRILIKYFLGTESVGLYSIPYEFSSFTLTNIFMVFSFAFFPVIVKELEQDTIKKTEYRIKQYAEVLLSFTMPFTIFMFVLAPFIAKLFLGENYNSPEAISVIRLVSIASFLAGLKAYFFDYSFQLGKNTYAQIIPVILSAISNVIANILFIPLYGVIGAVIATVISYLLGIIMSIIIGYRIFPLYLSFRSTAKILIINCLLCAFLLMLPFKNINWINLILIASMGSTLYVLLMTIFDINNFRNLLINKLRKG